jgi:hypothetical protein
MKLKFPKISIVKSKKKLKEEELIRDYEDGKILQIDNQINNKDYFKKIENDRNNRNK